MRPAKDKRKAQIFIRLAAVAVATCVAVARPSLSLSHTLTHSLPLCIRAFRVMDFNGITVLYTYIQYIYKELSRV